MPASSPEKGVLRENMNKVNAMKGKKRLYEKMRKTSDGSADMVVHAVTTNERVKKRDSRTLVKKRQPWDGEPRSPKRRS